ncbi:MAG: hypothetical protein OXI34_06455, partial [Chloroflexota bacterium]|nr:hypothetical protein [Chloroflexota bacterium]
GDGVEKAAISLEYRTSLTKSYVFGVDKIIRGLAQRISTEKGTLLSLVSVSHALNLMLQSRFGGN